VFSKTLFAEYNANSFSKTLFAEYNANSIGKKRIFDSFSLDRFLQSKWTRTKRASLLSALLNLADGV